VNAARHKEVRKLAVGLAFIAPNVAGFLAFTLLPLVVSFIMVFTNWDIQLHNMFRDVPIRFAGLANFARLFREPDFLKYLGNTLFLMMGIPFGVTGSLCGAILLSQDLRGGQRAVWLRLLCGVLLVLGVGALVLAGAGASAIAILVCGIAGLILLGGSLGGRTVYRTLFYFPHFTAGVATFLLWKQLYNPYTGPVNAGLRPLLDRLTTLVTALPEPVVHAGTYVCAVGSLLLLIFGLCSLVRDWRDGELGTVSLVLGSVLLLVPTGFAPAWSPDVARRVIAALAGGLGVGWISRALWRGRDFHCEADRGIGQVLILGGALMAARFALLGLGCLFAELPDMSRAGLVPPEWLTQYHWAKPAIMIMGFWAAIGSNNMLLYLAGLSNVPAELQEAADIDGASRWQRFRHVTWPQLAPITFFITIMATIHGLQGGFEMARTMTKGGPAGATTTLSYFVYTEGFETGRLGFASAVAWALFALVFSVTLFNWKFGNRYVND